MRIGVFGGSFNPPHYGHLLAAVYALKAYDLDQLWFVPAFEHAFGKSLVAFSHRQKMVQLLIEGLGPRFKVKSIEKTIKNPGKSWLTLQALQNKYPSYRFQWIIGSDLETDTRRWYNVKELKKKYGFLVVPRGSKHSAPFFIPDVRSMDIRRRIRRGQGLESLTPKSVQSYILQHRLF